MTGLERQWFHGVTRREALRNVAAFLAGSPLLSGQQDPVREHGRAPAMSELETPFDFEPVVHARLSRQAYDYTAYGVEEEFTLRRNRAAFDWVDLVPRGTVDTSEVRTETEILGVRMAYPILIAPTAVHAQLHPDGEPATFRGAALASNTPMIVSNNASMPVDRIAAAAENPMLWQLYPRQDPYTNQEFIETALENGARAIVVTIDQQASVYERGLRYRNFARQGTTPRRRVRPDYVPPSNPYRVSPNRLWYSPAMLEELRKFIKVPMLVKGVLTGDDAVRCLDLGADGIIVSNHGGRAMDYSPSTVEVLPEVVDAVKGRAPVLIDSGFRRGADVLKALAMGASAVCLGRVPRWGLAAYGTPGVQRILEIVQRELVMAMAFTGRPILASIDRTLVRTDFP
ncbi:MAG: alpha-hydroxy acid oxidase [Bryobacteraceae bacterium]